MLRDFTLTKKYEAAMSDEHPLRDGARLSLLFSPNYLVLFGLLIFVSPVTSVLFVAFLLFFSVMLL